MIDVVRWVVGYEQLYSITTDGQIYSVRANRFLKPQMDKYGYLTTGLSKDGKRKFFLVHRLVATTYLPNIDNLPEVNHIDGDKANNKLENLEWCTPSDNLKHAFASGAKCNKGTNNPTSKLDEEKVREIRILLKIRNVKEISNIYGVVPGAIYNIKSGKSWNHVK